jgi:hypothetical protein
MKTNSPSPRQGSTVALLVELLQTAYPTTWERHLRNRLGAIDPADLAPAEFDGFTDHVFWLVKQTGIKDPAAWIAYRAQRGAQAGSAAPAQLGSPLEVGQNAARRKSAEREPVALEKTPATTSAASSARPAASPFGLTTRAGRAAHRSDNDNDFDGCGHAEPLDDDEELRSTLTPVEAHTITADPTSQMTSPDIDNDVQNLGAAGSRKSAAKPPSASQPVQAGERVASGAPDTPEAEDEIDEITIRSKRYESADRRARRLGISRRSLNRKSKGLPQIKIGNKVFFEVPPD